MTQNLARKYRPVTLSDTVGQKHVKAVIAQMISRQSLPPTMVFCGSRGTGKAQPLSAKVLTPSGWRMMGELQPGDAVLSPDGSESKIQEVFPQPAPEPTYIISLSDGSSTRASAGHIWRVRDDGTNRRWHTFTTKELIERGLTFKSFGAQRSRYLLPTVDIDFGSDENPILDPYVLGAFVGDCGMSGGMPIYSCDEGDAQMISRILNSLPEGAFIDNTPGSACDYRITSRLRGKSKCNPVTNALRELGLWGKVSKDKFIPECVLRASRRVRIEFMRGLMDADGHAQNTGGCELSSMSERLVKDLAGLVRSLGGYASVTCRGIVTYSYKREKRQSAGPVWRIHLQFAEINPFWQPRKAKNWRPLSASKPGRAQRRIRSIELSGETEETKCILLDSDDHLYVTDDFIPTHNTSMGRITAAAINCRDGAGDACGTCPSCKDIQLGSSLFVLEVDAASNGRVDEVRRIQELCQYSAGDGWRAIILDEAHSLSKDASNALLKLLEEPPPQTIFILCTTEPDQILGTILSRAMTFEFRRLSTGDIVGRLRHIATEEDIDIREETLLEIANRAQGGMRDAVMMLDQSSRVGVSTVPELHELLGIRDYSTDLMEACAGGDLKSALDVVERSFLHSGDAGSLVTDLTKLCTRIIATKAGGETGIHDPAKSERATYLAKKLTTARLVACMKILWDLRDRTRHTDNDHRSTMEQATVLIADALTSLGAGESTPNLRESNRPASLEDMRAALGG